jgi:4-amino-4-deoxy-L-arabinose transferase-like glycosyltransferase
MQDPGFFSGLILFILLCFVGIACLYATWNHRATVRFQVKVFLCAFGLRFLMSVIIYQFGLVNVLKDEDASGWVMGAALYKDWVRKAVALWDLPSVLAGAFAGQHHGYGFLVGTLFYLTDMPERLAAAALNCFIGALTVVLVYRIARSLFSEGVAVKSAWWACLLPSMLIWSSQTLKEPTIILLETVVLYGCVRLKLSGISLRHVIACALAIVLVLPFRFYAAYIAGAAIAVALVMPQFGKRKMGILPAIGVAACLIPIIMMSGVFVQSEAEIERFDLQRIQKFKQGIAEGSGSGVTSSYDLKTPGGLGLATLVGGAHLMLAPFPWQLGGGSVRMVLTVPELIVWWWLFFVGVLPGLWYAIRNRFGDIQPLLFFLLGLGLLYSMMFGNVGLAYRQRAQLLPWLLIFGMVGLEQRALKRARRKQPTDTRQPQAQPSLVPNAATR